ncbi:twin-arginine translocase TatA/TatE family subunit [Pontibacter diazotrophicus]|uniref:Sec-independent protein translocase protein TatA n=1 Tax=Pontibacter diazotrophicus TaxID=1400979 RepID=A0A3D8LDJ4_9BACT|nr:twin-arginine translocase TatA/TatE family subunit [Pontibacter diazotrophicus]RDV15022.1 twin-arginine translocase TatA/TatE family subunit [Pontibacter diazotrophicus]
MENTNILAFIGGLGGTEVILILFVILLLFGAKRIPELAKGLGRGIREFKDATNEIKSEIEKPGKDEKAAAQRPVARDEAQKEAIV